MIKLALVLVLLSSVVNAACGDPGTNTQLVQNRCYCSPGYFGNPNTPPCAACEGNSSSQLYESSGVGIQKSICKYCKDGFYIATAADVTNNTAAVCNSCESDKATSSENQIVGQQECTHCKMDYYKSNADGPLTCSPCPANSYSKLGALNGITDCICNEGYSQNGSCNKCIAGYYKSNTVGDLTCTQCPYDTMSKANSVNGLSDCNKCRVHYYKYNTDEQSLKCTLCPTNAENLSGATNGIQDCICSLGFGPKTVCDSCDVGYYKFNTGGNLSCVVCPHFTTSAGNSINGVSDCNKCFPDYYKSNTSGNLQCEKCPLNTSNESGSANGISDCKCPFKNTEVNLIDKKCVCKNGFSGDPSTDQGCTEMAVSSSDILFLGYILTILLSIIV